MAHSYYIQKTLPVNVLRLKTHNYNKVYLIYNKVDKQCGVKCNRVTVSGLMVTTRIGLLLFKIRINILSNFAL